MLFGCCVCVSCVFGDWLRVWVFAFDLLILVLCLVVYVSLVFGFDGFVLGTWCLILYLNRLIVDFYRYVYFKVYY